MIHLCKMLLFTLIWPINEDIGDSVGLGIGYWKGHSLGSMKY